VELVIVPKIITAR